MQLYSVLPLARIRQVLVDLIAIALIVVFVLLGRATDETISATAAVGVKIEEAGTSFEGFMLDAAEALGEVPYVGDDARGPFDSASGTGTELAQIGRDQQAFIHTAASVAGLVVTLVPAVLVAMFWLPGRLRFVLRARSLRTLGALPDGRELLAARAVVDAPPRAVLAVGPDIVQRWRTGDTAAIAALAALALRTAGVKPARAEHERDLPPDLPPVPLPPAP